MPPSLTVLGSFSWTHLQHHASSVEHTVLDYKNTPHGILPPATSQTIDSLLRHTMPFV
mgnify:CR=1 FL=1